MIGAVGAYLRAIGVTVLLLAIGAVAVSAFLDKAPAAGIVAIGFGLWIYYRYERDRRKRKRRH